MLKKTYLKSKPFPKVQSQSTASFTDELEARVAAIELSKSGANDKETAHGKEAIAIVYANGCNMQIVNVKIR